MRKFVPDYSLVAKPPSDLTKNGVKFEMEDKQITAFENLKKNQNYHTEVHTDASNDGYGAILMQKSPDDERLHPVYYMSRKTSDAERKYCSYELEILAVVEAVKKFRVYLLGLHFKLVTDCNAFTKTLEKKDMCTRVARWILLLQEYDYKVEHRSGSRMRHVDFLSRYPDMTINEDGIKTRLKHSQETDDELKHIIHILQEQDLFDVYMMKGGILHKLVDDCEVIAGQELSSVN